MAVPWMEVGLAFCMSGLLAAMVHVPVPLVSPVDAETMEGRTVRMAGLVQDVQVGLDGHRGTLVADGHGIRFQAPGTDAPDEGDWVELRGTLRRDHGWLVLDVEPDPWTW